MGNRIKRIKSAGGVVVNREGKVALVNQGGDFWSYPKGTIKKGETKFEAAKREVFEETGIIELEFVKNLGSYTRYQMKANGRELDKTKLKTITLFLFKTGQKRLEPVNLKSNPEARWVERKKVADLLTHPKDKEFFLKIKNKI